jgi:hypothetical protein
LSRQTLRLTLECNNTCPFCAQRELGAVSPNDEEIRQRLRALREQGDEVSFIGGEPTLVPGLTAWIEEARKLGFRGIGLQTNGKVLADGALLQKLVIAGLTDLHFSIHGADAGVHDYHVGSPGAFAAVGSALAHARSIGLPVVVATVLTRSNYRVMGELPAFLKAAGVSAWLVTVPRIAGGLVENDERMTPRLHLAMPFTFRALRDARRLGIPAWVRGAPLCSLDEKWAAFASWILPEEPRRGFVEVCASCAARPQCCGVEAAYLKRFGASELSTREAVPATTPSSLTRLFVGEGELAFPAREAPPAPQLAPLTPLGLGAA